jgi:Skp family chaperone for outer membrane proteins
MKKVIFVLALGLALASCGSNTATTNVSDSTATDSIAVVDSAVTAFDSTVAEIPADSTK